jgi:hypothetical protein
VTNTDLSTGQDRIAGARIAVTARADGGEVGVGLGRIVVASHRRSPTPSRNR